MGRRSHGRPHFIVKKTYAQQVYQVNSVMPIQNNKEAITFMPTNQGEVIMPHDDPLVISTIIAKHTIRRILVDSGNLVNLIYWNCFEKMNISMDYLKTIHSPLFSFTGESIPIIEAIQLAFTLDTEPQSR